MSFTVFEKKNLNEVLESDINIFIFEQLEHPGTCTSRDHLKHVAHINTFICYEKILFKTLNILTSESA